MKSISNGALFELKRAFLPPNEFYGRPNEVNKERQLTPKEREFIRETKERMKTPWAWIGSGYSTIRDLIAIIDRLT